uniref:CCHC-type domain-containing protein n=1 Tax=Fagus sylvatica TaxID=28930 RepID=A0A2N9HD42_FAGSY
MGKREKRKAKLDFEEEEEGGAGKSANSVVLLSDDDGDNEANEDLSLKIVEKSLLMRAAKLVPDDDDVSNESLGRIGGGGSSSGVVVVSSSSSFALEEEEEEVVEIPSGSHVNEKLVKRERKKKKKLKKIEIGDQSVIVSNEKEKEEETVEPNAVEITDNIVFRKLLRGPRYFDPPDSGWGACFNCGEEGHSVANCTAAKRKKPCFVCGSLEHNAKQCSKGQDCFICKKGGHRAKDCPEKHKGGTPSLKICLKCGDSGHEMFSCRNDYSPDDLKACTKARGEAIGMVSPSSCYKCGEEGHFARECMSSARAGKRSREFSTPTLRFHNEQRDYSEFKSLPHDLGKVRKRKTNRNEEQGNTTPQKSKRRGGWIMEDPGDIPTPQKSKHRGGWITEDPGDFSNRKAKKNSWRSPATPSTKGHKISTLTAGGHISSPRASKKSSKVHSGTSMSQGSSKAFQHRYPASRFGNSGNDGMQRNYNWW